MTDFDIKSITQRFFGLLKTSSIEFRYYQFWLTVSILKAIMQQKNIIVELDAGMGKRILIYLLSQILDSTRMCVITPSRASVWDMALDFKRFAGSDSWFGVIASGQTKKLRQYILSNYRVIIGTPLSLANALARSLTKTRIEFDIVIINEVDKILRRTSPTLPPSDPRTPSLYLVQPWPKLLNLLGKRPIYIGLSGTLRDRHIIPINGQLKFNDELETLVNKVFGFRNTIVITMDQIIQKTPDASMYSLKNLTLINPVGINDPQITMLDKAITKEIEITLDSLKNSRIFAPESSPLDTTEKISRAISVLPNANPLKIKFLRLALARRHIYASVPETYRRFLSRPMFRRIAREHVNAELEDIIPRESKKILMIKKIVEHWLSNVAHLIILASFVRTAVAIKNALDPLAKSLQASIFLLTGRTFNKRKILEKFKSTTRGILILTPIAERDLDFPRASLVIIHDIISTVKSMYQRIKRARRGTVVILYYRDTFEERKLNILLSRIIKRYPWSIRIIGSRNVISPLS